MEVPPPKPPRSKRRPQDGTPSPTSSLVDDDKVGESSEKCTETGERLEHFLPANGGSIDDIFIEEKEVVPLEDSDDALHEEYVNVSLEETVGAPVEDPVNLEFQAGENTPLTETNTGNFSRPISCENAVMDDDPVSFTVVEQAVLTPTSNFIPESPSVTTHNGENCTNCLVEKVEPLDEISLTLPQSTCSSALLSPVQELDHVDLPQSSQESTDSVFAEESVQDNGEQLSQNLGASNETTEQDSDIHVCDSTPDRPGSCPSPQGSVPLCPEMTSSASIPSSTSAMDSSVATTSSHAGTKESHPPREAGGEPQPEGESKNKEAKVKSRKIKDDSSWIGRKQNWPGPSSQNLPRPFSDSASRPLSLEAKPMASLSSASAENFRTAGGSQSSSHGPGENHRYEEDGASSIRPWRSSDRLLSLSVNEPQLSPRKPVRSRSFNSATLTRLGDKGTFASSSTVPRGDTESLKKAMKTMGKEKGVKRDGRKWSKAPSQLKGALGKVFNPLRRTKSTTDSTDAGPTPPTNHSADNQEHESSEEDEKRDKRFPKLRHVQQPRPVSIVSEYNPDYPELFQYVFLVGVKEDRSKALSTYIIQQFPPQISKEDSKDPAIASVHQFCFPDLDHWKPVSSYESETYSFVLTSVEGNKRFGYCRRLLPEGTGERLPEVYCIISPHGCFDLYSKVLDHVEQRRAVSRAAVFTLLQSLKANPFPAPGKTASVRVISATTKDMEVLKLTRPQESRLEHVEFRELCNTLSAKSIVQVFATLLMERRIILSAHKLSTLSSCCHALLALLYPFEWYHTCIPLLPSSLIDICSSPAPFVIGVHPRGVKQLDHLEIPMEEALVVDLDKGKFLKRFGDESTILPRKLYKYLQHELESPDVQSVYKRASRSSRSYAMADDIVVNAFMTVFAYLFGNYKEFLVPDFQARGQKFQKDDFVHSFESDSEQRFLKEFHKTMMFDMFMHVREDPVEASTVLSGHFEQKLSELRERFPIIEQCGMKKRRFHVSKKVIPNKS